MVKSTVLGMASESRCQGKNRIAAHSMKPAVAPPCRAGGTHQPLLARQRTGQAIAFDFHAYSQKDCEGHGADKAIPVVVFARIAHRVGQSHSVFLCLHGSDAAGEHADADGSGDRRVRVVVIHAPPDEGDSGGELVAVADAKDVLPGSETLQMLDTQIEGGKTASLAEPAVDRVAESGIDQRRDRAHMPSAAFPITSQFLPIGQAQHATARSTRRSADRARGHKEGS